MTGCDHSPGFYGPRKKCVFEKLQKDQGEQHLIQNVGESLEQSDDVRDDMRQFVLLKIQGKKETLFTEACAEKLRKMKKKSLACLLLVEDTFHHHLDRVKY